MNIVILTGRLVATPELKETTQGTHVTTFSIAVKRDYTPKGADTITDYFEVIAWAHNADYITKYFEKGDKVSVNGSLQTRTYADKEGKNHKVTEVNCSRAELQEKAHRNADSGASDKESGFAEIDDTMGDLPF